MCKLCDEGKPQDHGASPRGSRRDFLKASTATARGARGAEPVRRAPGRGADDDRDAPPEDSGRHGRRYVIRGGAVMSMDPKVGDFAQADVLVEGKKIVAVGPNLHAARRRSDRRPRPHRHAGLRRYAPSPVRDGAAQLPRRRDTVSTTARARRAAINYFEYILRHVRPGVPAAGRLHQRAVRRRSASSTPASRRCTTSRRSITRPQHSDAAIQGIIDSGRRAVFGYFESAGDAGRRQQVSGRRASASRSSGSPRATSSSP